MAASTLLKVSKCGVSTPEYYRGILGALKLMFLNGYPQQPSSGTSSSPMPNFSMTAFVDHSYCFNTMGVVQQRNNTKFIISPKPLLFYLFS